VFAPFFVAGVTVRPFAAGDDEQGNGRRNDQGGTQDAAAEGPGEVTGLGPATGLGGVDRSSQR
jgi:hypothetical protein